LPNALDSEQHTEGDQFAWQKGRLAVIWNILHVVVYSAKQINDAYSSESCHPVHGNAAT